MAISQIKFTLDDMDEVKDFNSILVIRKDDGYGAVFSYVRNKNAKNYGKVARQPCKFKKYSGKLIDVGKVDYISLYQAKQYINEYIDEMLRSMQTKYHIPSVEVIGYTGKDDFYFKTLNARNILPSKRVQIERMRRFDNEFGKIKPLPKSVLMGRKSKPKRKPSLSEEFGRNFKKML